MNSTSICAEVTRPFKGGVREWEGRMAGAWADSLLDQTLVSFSEVKEVELYKKQEEGIDLPETLWVC